MKEAKIEKANNGYIVNLMNFTGEKRICKDFRALTKFLRVYFGEEKVKVEPIKETV